MKCEALRAVTGNVIRPGGFRLTERAVRFCGLGRGSRVLDVGCGTGATVGFLRDTWKIEARGIDLSDEFLAEGRARCAGLPIKKGKAQKLEEEDASLDGILCECSFSHFENRERVLEEFYRVLKTDGWLILTDMYSRTEGALEGFADALASKGFQTELREDHTEELKKLGIELILRYGSMEAFWKLGCSQCTSCVLGGCFQRKKAGYYLITARKQKRGGSV